ncbi:hypothetical protein OG897_03900 [Streptomyces sp. NBC_00237]|uniref:hypothetical protein n=1 Tax=Streptomyces sp. NBC_00237 TaxID=2975687 RepID=UPI0022541BA2|nr:hypothetical protein [Streptomyces sp. NBC_00237]MCX5200609.1 hypothetical protein [Streptomyces sp. NBC_00237]
MEFFSHADPPHHPHSAAPPPSAPKDPPQPDRTQDQTREGEQGPEQGRAQEAEQESAAEPRRRGAGAGKRKRRARTLTAAPEPEEPGLTLPTPRCSPMRQIRMLTALAALQQEDRAVGGRLLAAHAKLGVNTVTDSFAFLSAVGLTRHGEGACMLTEAGRTFAEQWPHDRTQARLFLRPLMESHWSVPAAAQFLAGGPLPQEELGRLLQQGLPGDSLRGRYLVEWLTIALLVVRDVRLNISLPTPEEPSGWEGEAGGEAATLLGMTRGEVQALPAVRYAAFLDGVVQTLRTLTPNPPPP